MWLGWNSWVTSGCTDRVFKGIEQAVKVPLIGGAGDAERLLRSRRTREGPHEDAASQETVEHGAGTTGRVEPCQDEVRLRVQRSHAAAAQELGQTPPLDPNNIVSIATSSKDHTTLVAALQAADYVRSVANPGPLTVFAPTDAAFGKLPAGTVEGLVKPEKQADLREILKYHVAAAVYEEPALKAMVFFSSRVARRPSVRRRSGVSA